MAESSSGPENSTNAQRPTGFWVSRLRLASLDAYLRRFPVPKNSVWVHALGGSIILLLLVETISGLLLSLYFRPELAHAHASLTNIVQHVPLGWLLQSLHRLGASAIVLLCFAHASVALFRRTFRSPRELTWWTGTMLGLLIAAFAYTGHILPWNQSARYAAQVGSSLVETVPLIGPTLANTLRGASQVGPETLHRAFVLHTGWLPATALAFALWHIILVHLHGLKHDRTQTTNLREALPRLTLVWVLALTLVVVTAALSPSSLGRSADLASPSIASRPAWYFLAVFQLARYGSHVALPWLVLVGVVLASAPWWGGDKQGPRGKKIVALIGSALLLMFVGLTVMGLGD